MGLDVLDIVWHNWNAYASRHGYTVLSGSNSAPGLQAASSSGKVAALPDLLSSFDWIVYLAPDTWFTRFDQPLESLLPATPSAALLVARSAADDRRGVRALLLRNTEWTRSVLNAWAEAAKAEKVRPSDWHASLCVPKQS